MHQGAATRRSTWAAWARFLLGLLVLASAAWGLMQGYTPPGSAGEVFRYNLRHDVDATPLFYTEVESLMPEE
ncbi:MAG TPA: hypothetical protein EYP56_13410 [Planctomycetaceae bacterium]|nr:hypothetical protein [Planctomycetaceae bacterium]HIQ23110.1 hypothetical protein [Planctomycetota bacterium]